MGIATGTGTLGRASELTEGLADAKFKDSGLGRWRLMGREGLSPTPGIGGPGGAMRACTPQIGRGVLAKAWFWCWLKAAGTARPFLQSDAIYWSVAVTAGRK